MLVARAYGKINLGLEIIGRRADGFHDIVTILQQVDVGDRLTFRAANSLTLETDDRSLEGDTNLVLRAARLLRSQANVNQGAHISLEKKIPVAAGLGGGSADAAMTLLALNQLWGMNWPVETLLPIARDIGSDVAFFLTGGTQLATGRGDILEPLATPRIWAVLAFVAETIPDKTKTLYQALAVQDFSDGCRTRRLARRLNQEGRIDAELMTSGFQRVTLEQFPVAQDIFAALMSAGAAPVLCGAGPTCLSLHDSASAAGHIAAELGRGGYRALVVSSVSRTSWLVDSAP